MERNFTKTNKGYGRRPDESSEGAPVLILCPAMRLKCLCGSKRSSANCTPMCAQVFQIIWRWSLRQVHVHWFQAHLPLQRITAHKIRQPLWKDAKETKLCDLAPVKFSQKLQTAPHRPYPRQSRFVNALNTRCQHYKRLRWTVTQDRSCQEQPFLIRWACGPQAY